MSANEKYYILNVWDNYGNLVFNKVYPDKGNFQKSFNIDDRVSMRKFSWSFKTHLEWAQKQKEGPYLEIIKGWPGTFYSLASDGIQINH